MMRNAQRADESLPILPDNWPAVQVFMQMGTQWRRAGLAGTPVGLDYTALPIVCDAIGHTLDAELLHRLRIVETAAISALLEAR